MTTAAISLVMQTGITSQANAQAGIFEVVHPDVKKGEIEIEVLNGFGLSNVEEGDERSAHEFAIGYGLTDFWKFTVAVEVANPRGESPEVEGFEFENLLLLPFFGDHDHGHDKDEKESAADEDDEHGEFSLGLFTALEIPREGGISEGALEVGPVFEAGLGPFDWVGNLLVEIPFESGEDAGLAYASQVIFPVSDSVGIGFENFGEFEGLFGGGNEQEHLAGPAIYYEYELPNGHVLEPRAAVLFGLNDESSDAVLSFNIEYKFGAK
ncbi:MAG: hypothetical protein ABJL18_07230 [Hyphomicrobiales bacterium]